MAVSDPNGFEGAIIRFTCGMKAIELDLTSHLTCITNDSGKENLFFARVA